MCYVRNTERRKDWLLFSRTQILLKDLSSNYFQIFIESATGFITDAFMHFKKLINGYVVLVWVLLFDDASLISTLI